MKVEYLLQQERVKMQDLYNSHKLWEETNGEQGLQCLNPEKLEQCVNRTDEQIIEDALKVGLWLEDLEDYRR